jgi:hypothetical protein
MSNTKSGWTIRFGLFILALAWFLFTLYQLANGVMHNSHPSFQHPAWSWVVVSDLGGLLGLAFRMVGGFLALITALFYLVKRDLSNIETLLLVRLVVLLEGVYWLTLFPSIMPQAWTHFSTMTIENNIPITVESIMLPILLIILFFNLSPKRAATHGIKWGLIAGTAYIFNFWLNNSCNWIAAVMIKHTNYLTAYPANMFSFLLTTVGLLALAAFSAFFTASVIRKKDYQNLNLKKVGFIVTLFGLYSVIIYVMYLILGPVGGWGDWYAWFIGHNMDLWQLALPAAGIAFLFYRKNTEAEPTQKTKPQV